VRVPPCVSNLHVRRCPFLNFHTNWVKSMTIRNQTAKPDSGQLVYLHITRPKCPSCGSPRLLCKHTDRRSSGVLVRHTVCAVCGQRIRVVLE